MLAVIDDRADRKTGIDRGVVAFTHTNQPSKRNQDAALFFGARVLGSNWILSSGYWRVWALRVNSTAHIRPEDISGLKAFAEDYPQADFTLLYRGVLRERREDIWAPPREPFSNPNRRIEFFRLSRHLGRREFSLVVHPLPFRDPLLETGSLSMSTQFRKLREPVGSPPGFMLGNLAYPVFSF